MIENGIYEDMDIEVYHSDEHSVSRSKLMTFDESPYRYWAKHLASNRPQQKVTPAMILGSAFHTLILEPHLFNKNYLIEPKKVLLKEAGRERYEEYKLTCEALETTSKTILNHEQMDTLRQMKDALNANAKAIDLIKDARIEESYFWTDAGSGLQVKSRPDILHSNMIVDLKTINDASPNSFQRSMISGGYHIQGAMVRDAVSSQKGHLIKTVINVCVETTYPYSTAIYIIDEAALDFGEQKYKQILIELKECMKDDIWPDFEIQTIGLPRWAT